MKDDEPKGHTQQDIALKLGQPAKDDEPKVQIQRGFKEAISKLRAPPKIFSRPASQSPNKSDVKKEVENPVNEQNTSRVP